MEQDRRNGIQRGAVGDVGARVAEDADDPICHRPAFPRQVVRQTVGGIDEGRQHDRFLGQFCRAKDLQLKGNKNPPSVVGSLIYPQELRTHLIHHIPVEAIQHRFSDVVLGAECRP